MKYRRRKYVTSCSVEESKHAQFYLQERVEGTIQKLQCAPCGHTYIVLYIRLREMNGLYDKLYSIGI